MQTVLARLRAKTDRDLRILVARQLQRSLTQVNRADYRDTVRTYQTARALLAVAQLSEADRQELEGLLAQLRAHIELPASAVA